MKVNAGPQLLEPDMLGGLLEMADDVADLGILGSPVRGSSFQLADKFRGSRWSKALIVERAPRTTGAGNVDSGHRHFADSCIITSPEARTGASSSGLSVRRDKPACSRE